MATAITRPMTMAKALPTVIRETIGRGGKLIIPSFAIGRVEEVLYWIRQLEKRARIPALPVYVDSPMASEALRFYSQRVSELDRRDAAGSQGGVNVCDRPLSGDCVAAAVEGADRQSPSGHRHFFEWHGDRRPRAASPGGSTAGPEEHDPVRRLPGRGDQGPGLIEGAPDVKIHGAMIPVRAHVARIDSMSAHADRDEILRWLGTLPRQPERLCFVHGEPGPMDSLKALVEDRLGLTGVTPEHKERLEL